MKPSMLVFGLVFLGNTLFAQSTKFTYNIQADSVRIWNCDSSELIIENHTRAVPGFLFNTGNGRTVFQRGVVKINGGLYLIGADTLNLAANAWVQGGNAFGTTGKLGTTDNNPLFLYSNNVAWMCLFPTGNLGIGTYTDAGYRLNVNGTANFTGVISAVNGARFYGNLSFDGTAAQNTIFANSLTFNTNNDFGNSCAGNYIFTNQMPVSNSGAGYYRLININKLVNRGSQDGEETAIKVNFSVTGTAGDLRALDASNGNVVIESGNLLVGAANGSTSSVDVTGSNGYSQLRLRTKYTPTSSADPSGNPGDTAVDDNYFYYKTSTGWKRTALSTF